MSTVTIQENGFIEIPNDIAEKLQINVGDILEFEAVNEAIIVKKSTQYTIDDVEKNENLSIVTKIIEKKD
jgi:AbrB family looped-hinge helix DNA binding protein